MQLSVSLSKLVPTKKNPRKVKPAKDAHKRLVASIHAHGLLQPLVVREDGKKYLVIAGNRRLAALREIHKGKDPKIPCVVDKAGKEPAEAISLAENFAREGMHPLDEAEAFANLATSDGKDAEAIAAEFGVTKRYVQQRMKLAALADEIKAAYRNGNIDTAIAEAFSAVPADQQIEIWKELKGQPVHARQVRNMIENRWIDAKLAIFEASTLPSEAVSSDLFSDMVLIERKAFMEAQTKALMDEREKLLEEGWSNVAVGLWSDLRDRLLSMQIIEPELDRETAKKLKKLEERKQKLIDEAENIDDPGMEEELAKELEPLEAEEREIHEKAPKLFSEEAKSVATVFLTLHPDGRVERQHGKPRRQSKHTVEGEANGEGSSLDEKPEVLTSDSLSDSQLAATFAYEAIGVREAVLKDASVRKRLLVMMLHERIHSEALALRRDGNGVTLHAIHEKNFKSTAFDALAEKRQKVDPFKDEQYVEDIPGYEKLARIPEKQIDALIEILAVECITAHMRRPTPLVRHLAKQLNVDLRSFWRPDAAWLGSYQKIQLAGLVTELLGPIHAPSPEKKKSELVALLEKLFADAGEGKLEDKKTSERVNAWLPMNMREKGKR